MAGVSSPRPQTTTPHHCAGRPQGHTSCIFLRGFCQAQHNHVQSGAPGSVIAQAVGLDSSPQYCPWSISLLSPNSTYNQTTPISQLLPHMAPYP